MCHILDEQLVAPFQGTRGEDELDLPWRLLAIVGLADGVNERQFLPTRELLCRRVEDCRVEQEQEIDIARITFVEGALLTTGDRAEEDDRVCLRVLHGKRLHDVHHSSGRR